MNDALVLIPFHRHERVFPWGAHLVREYAQRHVPDARVGLLDLASDAELRGLIEWKRFPNLSRLVGAVRATMPPGLHRDVLVPGPMYFPVNGDYEFNYIAGTLLLGDPRFMARLCALGKVPELTAAVADEHRTLLAEFDACLHARVGELVRDHKPLFGISHFGRMFTPALACAASLRRLYPESRMVLGGPQITPEFARDLLLCDTGIDAVVVGFGERPFAALVSDHLAGKPLDTGAVPYVVTRNSINVPGWDGQHLYRFDEGKGPLGDTDYDCAKVDKDNTLHVLPIRGCRWGVCTFCSDVFTLKRFRAPVIGAPDDKLARDIAKAVKEWAKPGAKTVGRLFIDAAEVYGDEAIRILSLVDENLKALDYRFEGEIIVFFYIPARKFDLEMSRQFRAFLPTTWHRYRIAPVVAIESLNETTLKSMKKGIDPLLAIASLKAGLDMGWQYVHAQFFLFYPGEESAAVREEVALMRSSLHILAAQPTRFNIVDFAVVEKEAGLYNEPETYGLRVQPMIDELLTLRFGRRFEPGSTFHASGYRLDPNSPKARDSKAWFDYLIAGCWTTLRLRAADSVGANRVRLWGLRAYWTSFLAGKTVELLARSALDRGLVERALISWWCARNGNAWYKKNKGKQHVHPRLEIVDGRLELDYPFPFRKRQTTLLSDEELAFLRAAYFPIAVAEIESRFGRATVQALIAKHQQLGSLVRRGDQVLCLANDPHHLETPAQAVASEPLVTLRQRVRPTI